MKAERHFDVEDKESLLPAHKEEKNSGLSGLQIAGVISCLMYSFCSVSMVLTNKAISTVVTLEDKNELPQLSIILFQCLLAVIFVEGAKLMGWIEYPSFRLDMARAWLPVNLLFIGMLASGFLSLVYVSVPMVTIFKNLTNLATVFGDWYFFGEEISTLTIVAVAVMTFGAIMAGANDLEFNALGYFWMILNCIFTSSYTLYMRYASVNIKLPRFGMVFYNNLLSVWLLLPVCIIKGELHALFNPQIMNSSFILMNFLAGFFGFYLNFSSLWCVSATSATTYAIVGSLNKVPITILGFTFFHAKMTNEGIIFVLMATLGGFLYAYAKLPK